MELCRQMHGFTLVVVRVVQTTNLEGITHRFLPWKDAMCKRVVSSRPTLPPGSARFASVESPLCLD